MCFYRGCHTQQCCTCRHTESLTCPNLVTTLYVWKCHQWSKASIQRSRGEKEPKPIDAKSFWVASLSEDCPGTQATLTLEQHTERPTMACGNLKGEGSSDSKSKNKKHLHHPPLLITAQVAVSFDVTPPHHTIPKNPQYSGSSDVDLMLEDLWTTMDNFDRIF